MADTTNLWPLLFVAMWPRVVTPGSDPPLNQTVGHSDGSSPRPPLFTERMDAIGDNLGCWDSCCNPAKARQTSSGDPNHSMLSMSRGSVEPRTSLSARGSTTEFR